MPILTLLVARALNGAIGNANRLPWHLPEDLAHFKRTTMGRTIVMGRRTWESIGRVLPGRQMVVITPRQTRRCRPGVSRAASLAQAVADHATEDEIFIVGGARVYAGALPLADRIILTEVELTPHGRRLLPRARSRRLAGGLARLPSTSVNGTRFSIITYERRRRRRTAGAAAGHQRAGPAGANLAEAEASDVHRQRGASRPCIAVARDVLTLPRRTTRAACRRQPPW